MGAIAGSVQGLLEMTAALGMAPRYFRRPVGNQGLFDSGFEASRSQKPHRRLSSGIRTTEQISLLSSDIIARLLRACATGCGRFIALSNSSPIGDVRPSYGGDLLDNHDLATS
jgi:hypothetical protein